MTDRLPPAWRKISFITVPAIIILGDLSGYFSQSGFRNPWFAALAKPFFMPPGWLFGIAWNVLYALMGISLAIVLAEPKSSRRTFAVSLFAAQLALNYAWSPIFFLAHDILFAKVVIFVLAAVAAATAGQFMRIRKIAGLLLIPYLGWLVFAASLNTSIAILNPAAGRSLLG